MDLSLDHFTANGSSKRAFATVEEAWEFRKSLTGMKSKKAHQCGTCGYWHLDSKERADRFQFWYEASRPRT